MLYFKYIKEEFIERIFFIDISKYLLIPETEPIQYKHGYCDQVERSSEQVPTVLNEQLYIILLHPALLDGR